MNSAAKGIIGFFYQVLPSMAILFCFLSTPVLAANVYIQDEAKVVSQKMTDKLEKVMKEIESKSGLHIEMVILPNVDNQNPQAIINGLTQQFDKDTSAPKKVLTIIVLSHQEVIIKPTTNIAAAFEDNAIKDISANIKAQITAKDYDEMARIGVAGIFHYYQKKFPGGQKPKSLTTNYFNAALMIILAVGIIFAVRIMQNKKL